jgi:dTMP kinase
MRGPFITLEGIDGCGKSTQLKMLVGALAAQGVEPIFSREPGGTSVGERLRPLLLSAADLHLSPLTELLLLVAARAQHVEEVIRPGIESGRVVVSDRYIDSSVAFQGYGRGLNLETVFELNRIATGGLLPDLTILYDLDVSVARARLDTRPPRQSPGHRAVEPARDRFDDEDVAFHERVRRGYLELASRNPERIAVVDASQTADRTHSATLALVRPVITRVLRDSPR